MADPAPMEWLELQVGSLRQLFNSMDPAPFRQRDLDPDVAVYVREWAEELSSDARLGIRVKLTGETAASTDVDQLRGALHENFARSAIDKQREVRGLFRDGRISLVIGISFLAFAFAVAEWAATRISNPRHVQLIEESVVIGGWVALWHPINIFLYDWWPIRASAKLFDRLCRAEVELDSVVAAR